ncbi:dihydroneopterin aldolase family protein [Apiospora arundinis]
MLSSIKNWITMEPAQFQLQSADPPAPLLTNWQVAAAAGEPLALVRVHNLQGTLPVGRDAWGRANKPQPALLSTEVSFQQPFHAAAAEDRVSSGDTAHYGNLSKRLRESLDQLSGPVQPPTNPDAARKADAGEGPSAADAFEMLWVGLTGRVVDGSRRALPLDQVPFLDAGKLRSLTLTINLPKASLLGAGVALAVTACFKTGLGEEKTNPLQSYARSLRIHGLHIPTLIGVNANERQAKQMVVADVEIDRLDTTRDIHPEVEKLVFETMDTSSFETLEALGTLLADKILNEFKVGDEPKTARERGWQVKISLAKPIAVPFADCPAVEIKAGNALS